LEIDPEPDVDPDPELVDAGLIEMVACADLLGSAVLVTTTVALVLLVTVGAVNIPVLEIEPPFADHVTAVFVVFETVAKNCCWLPETMLMATGETETPTAACGFTVTLACADFVVSAALVAFTVTVLRLETEGAVNLPLLEMVPLEADQITTVFEVLLTLAVNCWLPPEGKVTVPGATAMPIEEDPPLVVGGAIVT
jgi:hypothetical protein